MSRKRLLLTSAGTIGCALAIGFFMQQGARPAPQASIAAPPIAPEPVEQLALNTLPAPEAAEATPQQYPVTVEPVAETPVPPALELDKITLTSIDVTPVLSSITSSLLEAVALDPLEDPGEGLAAPSDPSTPYLGCDVRVNAQAVEMGSVRLTIDAPCNANERITIHHTGMMFSKVTSREGRVVTTVPALSETAIFMVQLENGSGAVESVEVGSLDGYERIALQWSGPGGFQIHAREFGAAYGSAGHVWSGSDLSGGTGQLVRLGDLDALNPNIAEIYTYPVSQTEREGTVSISVEAEVTDANCGRDIAAQSIELRERGSLRTRDLVLTMPDCSAVGDFLVLNNLVDDLKIASR